MADLQEYRGKVIVITGASSGFGKGAALEFARRGAHVVLAARSQDILEGLARECKVANFLHHLMPNAVEKFLAVDTEKAQLQDAPPGPKTSGTIHTPTDR